MFADSKVAGTIRGGVDRVLEQRLRPGVKRLVARTGYQISKLDDESRRYLAVSHNTEVPLPPDAEETLRSDNPQLVELQRTYDAIDSPATSHTQWTTSFLRRNLSLAWFRGDNAYVWQFRVLRGAARARMYCALLDVQSRDRLGLLSRLDEDAAFGAWTFVYGHRPPVSRDLLDSVNEINYLNARMDLSTIPELRVLDIGAGYGRLAHRMSAALPNLVAYDCIDGVAVSTFLCDYYLRYRGVPNLVRVVPLQDHESLRDSYDIAVNIHSFAECSLDTIRWWMDRIAEHNVEWLLIVPNTPAELVSTELDGSKKNFLPVVQAAGYELVDTRWTHESDELRDLIQIYDKYFLFRHARA